MLLELQLLDHVEKLLPRHSVWGLLHRANLFGGLDKYGRRVIDNMVNCPSIFVVYG